MDKVTKRQIKQGQGQVVLGMVQIQGHGLVTPKKLANRSPLAQPIAFLPEECVAELGVVKRRMRNSKCSTWEIRWELFQQVVGLFWAYYIQINLENLWLPPGDQRIDE